jgi:hypothetical protein
LSINECEIWAQGTAEQLNVVHQRVLSMGELKQPVERAPLAGERGRFSVYYRVSVTSSAPAADVPVRKTRRKPTS